MEAVYKIAGETLNQSNFQNLQAFWKMEAVYKIAGEILNQSNLQNHLDLLKMEAQLQEQQSRDKEIKAVSKIYFENMFFIPKILLYISRTCFRSKSQWKTCTQAAAGLSQEKLEEYKSIFSFFDRCLQSIPDNVSFFWFVCI